MYFLCVFFQLRVHQVKLKYVFGTLDRSLKVIENTHEDELTEQINLKLTNLELSPLPHMSPNQAGQKLHYALPNTYLDIASSCD